MKFETIVQLFKQIMQLNAVIILKSTNEHYRKVISKSGPKMDLYPAMQYDRSVCTSLVSLCLLQGMEPGVQGSKPRLVG